MKISSHAWPTRLIGKNSKSSSPHEAAFRPHLSPSLVSLLSDVFPDSNHVFRLGLDQSSDSDIRLFAAQNMFTIVTKDAFYSELHSLYGEPPKIVWIRRGNCSTSAIEAILRDHQHVILELTRTPDAGVLTIY